MEELVTAYSGCETEKAKSALLSDVVPPGNKRKIGPKLSEKVWRTVCGVESVTKPVKPLKKRITKKKEPEKCLFLPDDE